MLFAPTDLQSFQIIKYELLTRILSLYCHLLRTLSVDFQSINFYPIEQNLLAPEFGDEPLRTPDFLSMGRNRNGKSAR